MRAYLLLCAIGLTATVAGAQDIHERCARTDAGYRQSGQAMSLIRFPACSAKYTSAAPSPMMPNG